MRDFFGAPITSGIYAREPLSLKKSHFKMVNAEGDLCGCVGELIFESSSCPAVDVPGMIDVMMLSMRILRGWGGGRMEVHVERGVQLLDFQDG